MVVLTSVSDRETALRRVQEEMNKITSVSECKVDRSIVKNLIVNYFSVPQTQRPHVLRVIVTVLDFNHEERIKVGIDVSGRTWIPRWFTKNPYMEKQQQATASSSQSLSAAFVQFLENESRPIPAMKLPAEAMAQDIAKKVESRTANPFASQGLLTMHSATNLPTSHLLMKPMSSTLPSFTPVPVANHGGIANTVLKEIL